MKKNSSEAKVARLLEELKQAKKENIALAKKLERANNKKAELQKKLKKNGAQKLELSKEQQQSLSNLLKDTDILNSLFD